jgi:hypothetical protein
LANFAVQLIPDIRDSSDSGLLLSSDPRQKAASFTIDQALEKMQSATGGAVH